MKKILAAGLMFILPACTIYSQSAIKPESLINSSVEKISFPVSGYDSLTPIENWINGGDAPSKAEISCAVADPACASLKDLLSERKISFKELPASDDSGNVSLLYNRLVAKNCNASQFGCSTSINSIHMIANREQFINPPLSDFQDADNAVKALDKIK